MKRVRQAITSPRCAYYLCLLVLTPCLVYTVYYAARALRFDYIAIPAWDSWRCVRDLDALCRFDLRPLWIQHYDHRVISVQILYWLDFVLLRGRQFLPIACEIVCQAAQLALLWWLLKEMTEIPTALRLALGAACGVLMTSAIYALIILIPFLVQWYLSLALAALAFLLLWRAAQTGRLAGLVISAAAAVVVTYTTGNGMLLWPVLVWMAVLLRIPRRRIAGLAVTGAIASGLYFLGYEFMARGQAALLVSHPFYAAAFVAIYLGAPASYASNLFGGCMGLVGILITMLALVVAVRQRRAPAAFLVAGGVCLYIVCSALLVAYGRMDPSDLTFRQAKLDRYAMVPLTFWANLAVVAAWLGTSLPRGRQIAWQFTALAFTAFILIAVVGQQASSEKALAKRQALGEETAIALETDIKNREVIAIQDADFVLAQTPVLRRRRLSIFSWGRQDWLGQPVSRLFRVSVPDACFGAMENFTPITNAYRAEGWAWDLRKARPPRDIILTDASGIIVGLGETRPGGYPRPASEPTWRPASDLDWVGFARAEHGYGGFEAYAIVDGGRAACRLGAALEAPRATPMDADQVGAAIHIPAWQADPAWTRNGYHPSVGTLAGEILYGSYSGSDANQGTLTSAAFETGGRNCLALPVAHGPSTIGQSVRLANTENGRTVAAIPLAGANGNWQYWRIHVEGVRRLRIIAEDQGSQWGQWVAVGEPHACKR